MTVWHDQPPRSRRDARRNARADEATPEVVPPSVADDVDPIAEDVEPILEPEGDDAPRSTPERPLTRRELREMRARAAEAAQASQPAPEDPTVDTTVVAGEIPAEAVGADDVVDDAVDADVVDAELVDAEAEPQQVHSGAPSSEADPTPEAPTVTDDTGESENAEPSSLTPFDVVFAPQGDAGPLDSSVADQSPATPYRHWSTQAALDDLEPGSDGSTSRNVGVSTGAITTHALVLPSSPESGDQLLTPLTNTGEIMVTGSVDLPRSFGSTGAHPVLFDSPDVDALIEASDREDAPAGAAPVRAIRAVASSGSARSVIEAPAPAKSRLPLVLGAIGGSLLLIAIGAVIAAIFFNAT